MHSAELYHKLKPFLATTANYSGAAKNTITAHRIEFVPEEKRRPKCWLPVKWVPLHKKLWKGWVRLTYDQFCRAYSLPLEC